MRVAILGAGAIGAYVAAALHRGGADVHLIARGDHLAAVRRDGVRVLSPRGDFIARPAIGCVVYSATEIAGPGVIRHIEGTRFSIGEPAGTFSNRCRTFSDAMVQGGLKCPVEADLRNDIWIKLMGKHRLQSAQRAHPGHHDRDVPPPRHPRAGDHDDA